MSKYEDKVAKLLNENNVSYFREYVVPKCTHNGNPLRFDFAIVGDFGAPYTFIEVNGEQHYKYISKFYKTKSQFKTAQERDRIKIKYCLLNRHKLIIIPYWEIESLTFEKIFNTEDWIAKSKFHNDRIKVPK